jgi:hypothetical protein
MKLWDVHELIRPSNIGSLKEKLKGVQLQGDFLFAKRNLRTNNVKRRTSENTEYGDKEHGQKASLFKFTQAKQSVPVSSEMTLKRTSIRAQAPQSEIDVVGRQPIQYIKFKRRSQEKSRNDVKRPSVSP